MKEKVLKNEADFDKLIREKKFAFGQIGDAETLVIFTFEFELKKDSMSEGGVPEKFDFFNCVFKEKVSVKILERNFRFEGCQFEKTFVCRDSEFKGKARLRNCVFHGTTDFRNTKFIDLADFWRSTFMERAIFYKTDFQGITVFSAATFEKNVLFTYALIEKPILFRGTTLKAGIDLSTAIIPGNIGTYGLSFGDFRTKNGKLNDDDYEKAISESGDIPIKNKRETFRILKQANIQQNNAIESIPFQVLEKKTLLTELTTSISRKKSKSEKESWIEFLAEKWNSIWDLVVLFLNWISNSFGRAPFQSAIFTLLVGAIFFYLNITQTEKYDMALNWEWEIVCTEIPNYVRFILPTHSLQYMEDPKFYEKYAVTNWYYLWDMLGRIFIGFGIYQTIQAFRKFR